MHKVFFLPLFDKGKKKKSQQQPLRWDVFQKLFWPHVKSLGCDFKNAKMLEFFSRDIICFSLRAELEKVN